MLMHLFQSWVYNFIKLVNGQCFSNQCGSYIDIQLPWLFLSQQLTGLDRNIGHTTYTGLNRNTDHTPISWLGKHQIHSIVTGLDRNVSHTSFVESVRHKDHTFLFWGLIGTEVRPPSRSLEWTELVPFSSYEWQALKPYLFHWAWQAQRLRQLRPPPLHSSKTDRHWGHTPLKHSGSLGTWVHNFPVTKTDP